MIVAERRGSLYSLAFGQLSGKYRTDRGKTSDRWVENVHLRIRKYLPGASMYSIVRKSKFVGNWELGCQGSCSAVTGAAVPPLLYADDMVLLATSAAGLQRQLNLLQQYCRQWGLTVNIDKTKLMLLGGPSTRRSRQQRQQASPSPASSCFKYLGIAFHSSTCLAGAAAPARAQLARLAMHNCRTRCAEMGIEAAPVQLRLFGTMVDSVLSHGAEVWGVQLAAKAACCQRGSAGSAAEKLQLSYLRHLLEVRQSTPNAVLLAETGERPLWQRWLRRAAKLWNKTLEERPGSLLQQAFSVQRAARRWRPPPGAAVLGCPAGGRSRSGRHAAGPAAASAC